MDVGSLRVPPVLYPKESVMWAFWVLGQGRGVDIFLFLKPDEVCAFQRRLMGLHDLKEMCNLKT